MKTSSPWFSVPGRDAGRQIGSPRPLPAHSPPVGQPLPHLCALPTQRILGAHYDLLCTSCVYCSLLHTLHLFLQHYQMGGGGCELQLERRTFPSHRVGSPCAVCRKEVWFTDRGGLRVAVTSRVGVPCTPRTKSRCLGAQTTCDHPLPVLEAGAREQGVGRAGVSCRRRLLPESSRGLPLRVCVISAYKDTSPMGLPHPNTTSFYVNRL